jgi:hypothetical protein
MGRPSDETVECETTRERWRATGPGSWLISATGRVDIWFRAFEFPADEATRRSAERFLTTTLLHELIHWARDQNHAGDTIDDTLAVGSDPPKKFGPDAEAGHVFEELAFGTSNACSLANLRIASKGLIDLELGF